MQSCPSKHFHHTNGPSPKPAWDQPSQEIPHTLSRTHSCHLDVVVPSSPLWDAVLQARESFLPFRLSCPELGAHSVLQRRERFEGWLTVCWIRPQQLTRGGWHHSLLSALCELRWFYKHNTHIMKSHSANWSSFASDSSHSALGGWNLLRTAQECCAWGCQSNTGKFRPTTCCVSRAGIKNVLPDSLYLQLWPFFPYFQVISNLLSVLARCLQAGLYRHWGNTNKYNNIHCFLLLQYNNVEDNLLMIWNQTQKKPHSPDLSSCLS